MSPSTPSNSPLVLLTGATGLIGFHVLLALLHDNYNVRITVRTEEKAQHLLSHPVLQPYTSTSTSTPQLTTILIPDITAPNAFAAALHDITHIIHTGSPVPIPGTDPVREIWTPTVTGTAHLLHAALHSPTIQRVLLTSSIVAIIPPAPCSGSSDPATATPTITPAARVTLPDQITEETIAQQDVFTAYVLAKITALNEAEAFMKTRTSSFSLAHIIPGYVLGRDRLVTTADMGVGKPSSCGILLRGLLGMDGSGPLHGAFVHVDDLAEVFVRVLEREGQEGQKGEDEVETEEKVESWGAYVPVEFGEAWEVVEQTFPKEVAEGILKRGRLETITLDVEARETEEKVLGRRFRGFEVAVRDVVGWHLELLGREK
ncbi:NAD(P)-binding protein [Aspergillus saccharolyticus JOP 1030-1]|uniref:NAD(P)-binding protein n=1 Tax=Aspergillus saccharolyticus JOP 1030-1 TaxID=1450539 RepID=A0A318ZHY1_9EURO|nr:NAD(P)-binding protein [Aspergillus saccharolyticus JOP 1030-1]PYH45994.1 NAD(P)-binding protein [Aspergillus saccharolyticus JOP 1030-1]